MGRWSASILLLRNIILKTPTFISRSSHQLIKPYQPYPVSGIGKHIIYFRFISANPCPSDVYDQDFPGGDPDFKQRYGLESKDEEEEEERGKIPVKAYFLCTRCSLFSQISVLSFYFSFVSFKFYYMGFVSNGFLLSGYL